jgi:hypothetical protein
MSIKVSCSIPDDLAVKAAETYHTAKGEEFGMSELVQVAFAALSHADDKTLKAAREDVVKAGGDKSIVLPGLKTKQPESSGS